MNDFVLVEPKGWEYDLHSVYSAYIGYFQIYNIPWYERSWGHFFESFDEFLAFSWPVITVTDVWTGKAHIVTRLNTINSFLKMIKTRFGETLPQAPNILLVTPFETGQRRLRHVSDYASYTRMYATLPAGLLAALKARVRTGDTKAIQELWERRDKTYLAIDFECNERNEKTCLEWGYAAIRCGHLEALGHWPPIPDTNYRKGHYIVAEYVDKVTNRHRPNYPWQYAFGDSQVIQKAKLPVIIQTIISSLASPESETMSNTLVLVGHGMQAHLSRLEEMKIRLPNNMLILDLMVFERALYAADHRGVMIDPVTEKPRSHGTGLSLENILISFTLPPFPTSSPLVNPATPVILPQCPMHNAGNDALLTLFALQKLLEPASTKVPTVKKVSVGRPGMQRTPDMKGGMAIPMPPLININGNSSPMMHYGGLTPSATMPRPQSAYDLAGEFGQMQLSSSRGLAGHHTLNPDGWRERTSMRSSSSPAGLGIGKR